ncbi:HAD hydrolase-like protein [Halovulum sp. GXIMD14793]
MRVAVFDLDGTLADTSGDLIAAANACFDEDWLDPAKDQATAFRGGRAMLRLALQRQGAVSNDRIEALFPELLDYYAANIDRHTRLYPGVEAALDALTAAGWTLAVCTNKPEGLAETVLTRLGLRPRFAVLIGADTLPVRKPDPAPLLESIARSGGVPEQAVLIGDTDTDRNTAKAANVPCILVTFGPLGRTVDELSPEGLLDDYSALPDMLGRMIDQAKL